MPTLAISSDLLDGYARLERRTRNRVSELADIFRRSTVAELGAQAGVNLEKHTGQRDERARTVRITDNLRGILCALSSDRFILHLILPHDQSDQWMARNRFRANIQTGALEVVDIEAVEEAFQAPPQQTTDAEPLFAHRRDKDFRQLGVDEELLPALRLMTDEDHLSGLLNFLPPGQAEALIELSGNASVDEIFGRIAGDFEPGSIGEDDLEAALETAASRAQFHVIADEAELQEMLARPLAKWKTFLHPSQHALAYKPTFNGPARVTAAPEPARPSSPYIARPIWPSLLTQRRASDSLHDVHQEPAEAIEADLVELGGADVLDRVEVIHADLLAHRIVREAEGEVKIANDADMQTRWQAAADELGLDYRGEFLANEWEQVILAQGCRSRTEYFSASRAGRGVRLDRRARADVWRAVEHVTQQLADRKERTFSNLPTLPPGTSGAERCGPTFTSSSTKPRTCTSPKGACFGLRWPMPRTICSSSVTATNASTTDARHSPKSASTFAAARTSCGSTTAPPTKSSDGRSGYSAPIPTTTWTKAKTPMTSPATTPLCTAPSRHCRGLRADAPKSTPSSSR